LGKNRQADGIAFSRFAKPDYLARNGRDGKAGTVALAVDIRRISTGFKSQNITSKSAQTR